MIQGELFTRDYLLEGVLDEPAWDALPVNSVRSAWFEIEGLLRRHAALSRPNEAETEKELIFPILSALGWDHVMVQQTLSLRGRQDVPDGLMLGDQTAADLAAAERIPANRFRHGLAVLESKRWGRALDREDRREVGEEGVPSTQMLRYLRRVDDLTRGGLRWGVLTNGRHWRLYWQGAVSVAEDFLEIDLGQIFGLPGVQGELVDEALRHAGPDHVFRLFFLLFGRDAFVPSEAGRTLHQRALEEGRRWQEKVTDDLRRVVYREVFPTLVAALSRRDPARPPEPDAAYLDLVRKNALYLLYRLLFVLHAEDRNLLPDESGPYADYSLTRLRHEIAERKQAGRQPATGPAVYWSRLQTVFRAIAEGNDDLGIPQYNGGLFDPATAPLLERSAMDDAALATAIYALSHVPGARGARYVNYRDLRVRQLGSIYEGLLEHGLRLGVDGAVEVAQDAEERRDSGSYYTPEPLVALVIDKTIGPLVEERLARFREAATETLRSRRDPDERRRELEALDPAAALLDLRVCDPAMGSGHFLVSLVDWLTDRVLAAMEEAEALALALDYVSPVRSRAAAARPASKVRRTHAAGPSRRAGWTSGTWSAG